MKNNYSRLLGIGSLLIVVVCLLSFVDRDNSKNLAQLRGITKTTVPIGKPGFKVDRSRPLSSCADMVTPIIQMGKGGLLRGVVFGVSKSHVKDLEQAQLLQEEDLKMIYAEQMKDAEGNAVDAQLTYDFDHNKALDIVSIEYFVKDELTAEVIVNEYVSYFNARLGTYTEDADGYLVWEGSYSDPYGAMVGYKLFMKNVTVRDDAGVSLQFITNNMQMVTR